MKERVTFVHPPGGEIDPKLIEVQSAGLLGPVVNTTREDRLTIPLDEIPTQFSDVLQRYSSLQIRWASPEEQDTISPFSSRISPGLHVSYTAAKGAAEDGYVWKWIMYGRN